MPCCPECSYCFCCWCWLCCGRWRCLNPSFCHVLCCCCCSYCYWCFQPFWVPDVDDVPVVVNIPAFVGALLLLVSLPFLNCVSISSGVPTVGVPWCTVCSCRPSCCFSPPRVFPAVVRVSALVPLMLLASLLLTASLLLLTCLLLLMLSLFLAPLLLFASHAVLAVSCAVVGPAFDVFLPLLFLPSIPCYG